MKTVEEIDNEITDLIRMKVELEQTRNEKFRVIKDYDAGAYSEVESFKKWISNTFTPEMSSIKRRIKALSTTRRQLIK